MEQAKKRRRTMEYDGESSQTEVLDIQDDVLHQLILPQLPSKTLSEFQKVSKAYKELISSDFFSTLQSVSPSPSSTGFVYLEKGGLAFFPEEDIIGVPDPTLKFMVKSPEHAKLLSSTNGLLLFYLFGRVNSLCVCNPATETMQIIPKEPKEDVRKEMGLAFNPRASPGRFVVVDPLIDASTSDIEYSFNIFRSETGTWSLSKHTILVAGSRNAPTRALYAQGLLYWCCIEHLLWFDPEKECGGTIPLPYEYESARLEIDAVNDEIYCMSVTTEGGLEVWLLIGGAKWERLYELSQKKLIQESPEKLYLGLPGDEIKISTGCKLRSHVAPLAFDGTNLFLAVDSKGWRRVTDHEYSISLHEYSSEEDEYLLHEYDLMEFEEEDGDWIANLVAEEEEDLLCCNMFTGEVTSTGRILKRTDRNWQIMHYHSSIVALPPISKQQ